MMAAILGDCNLMASDGIRCKPELRKRWHLLEIIDRAPYNRSSSLRISACTLFQKRLPGE